jgi:virginiamycin B lyase
MERYPAGASPLNIAYESAQRIWFTAPTSNVIGLLVVTSTVDFNLKQFPITTADSRPYDLVVVNGAVWFTEFNGNKLAKLDPISGAIQEFAVPTQASAPTGIALAPDGALWFAERNANKVGRFDPATSQFKEFSYAAANAQFEDIAVSADNKNVWLTSPSLNRMVQFSPGVQQFFDVPTSPFVRPLGIVTDDSPPLFTPWVVARPQEAGRSDVVGRYAPGTISLWNWQSLPASGDGASGLAYRVVADIRELWFTGFDQGTVGRLVTTANGSRVRIEKAPIDDSGATKPWGITAVPQGDVWIAASGSNEIIRWRSPYFHYLHLPVIAK